MLKWISTAACLCATIAQAQASNLSGQQINDLVAGATVEIETPLGVKLPVRYARDGKLFGEAGGLAWFLGTPTDKGRWWVAADQLCHKWNRWLDSEPQCMQLSKEGRLIQWRSQDGYTGTATITVPAPVIQAGVASLPALADRAKASPPPQAAPKAAGEPPAASAGAADRLPDPAAAPKEPKEAAVQPPAPEPAPAEAPSVDAPPQVPPQQAFADTKESLPVPPQPQPAARRAAQPMFKVVNVRGDDVLNVRSGPSADFEIVGGLPPGSRGIAITSTCQSAWCPVQHRAASGWVNSAYLAAEDLSPPLPGYGAITGSAEAIPAPGLRDSPDAPRSCLTAAAHSLLDRIERQFGPVKVVSTCRAGAFIPGTAHPSRHASGNAVDFLAGSRKAAVIEWLIANHRAGGTMTYAGMDHVHMDIGPHFVSIANGPRWLSWRDSTRDFPHPQRPASGAN
jgi:SH3 domain-containing protein